MGQQNVQAEEVYYLILQFSFTTIRDASLPGIQTYLFIRHEL